MKNKFRWCIKVILLVAAILSGIILLDTIQARIFKHGPLISWKEELYDNNKVYKGILVDTYYCTKEEDILTISWHFKGDKFSCPVYNIEENTDTERKQNLINLLKRKMIGEKILDEENLEKFKVIGILEYGYYRDTPEKRHFQFEYEYLCKDNTKNCLLPEFQKKTDLADYTTIWIYTDEKEIYNISTGISLNINDNYETLSNIIK